MAVLAALKKDRLGEWPTVADYLSDLRKRETNSVAALALALGATPQDRRELAEGAGLSLLVEVASEKNSTTIFPVPIDLLTPFLKKSDQG